MILEDGTGTPARFPGHPDPRIAAVLAQMREASIGQALARLPPACSERRKPALVLCNIPVPNLPITRLVTWDEIVTGVPADPLAAKRAKQAEAIAYTISAPVAQLRLSAHELHENAPRVWPTLSAAKEWRRGLATDDVIALAQQIAKHRGWAKPVTITSPAAGDGRSIPALLFVLMSPEQRNRLLLDQLPSPIPAGLAGLSGRPRWCSS